MSMVLLSCNDISRTDKESSEFVQYELPNETIRLISDSIVSIKDIAYITVSSNIDINEVFFAFHYKQKWMDTVNFTSLTERRLLIKNHEFPVFSDEDINFVVNHKKIFMKSEEFQYCYAVTNFRGKLMRLFCY